MIRATQAVQEFQQGWANKVFINLTCYLLVNLWFDFFCQLSNSVLEGAWFKVFLFSIWGAPI